MKMKGKTMTKGKQKTRDKIVAGDPEALRLAAELPHGIGEHLGVRYVDVT